MSISISAVRADMRGKTLLAKSLAAVLFDLTDSPVLVAQLAPDSPDAPVVAPGGNPGDTLDRALQGCVEGVHTLEVSVKSGQDPNYYVECAADLVSRFTDRFPIIIFDVNAEPRGLLDAIDLFSDVHIEIGDTALAPSTDRSEKKTRCFRVVNRYNTSASPVNLNHCEPFVMPRDIWVNAENSTETIRNSPRSMLGLPVQRLARKILGATVGVALGGGAAFGIAHLGVLKVLERHNIPIDLIAGCSQGSIIGIGYAAGVSTERMIEIALQLGHWRNSLLPFDPTITRPGLLLGNRFVKLFEPFLSTVRTFADLLMPCMTVATNIESGERVPIGSGLLTTAFRASAAVPMVFAPVKIGDKVLVDGGVSDPVPAEVVNAMGADLCVAVNVVPPPKLGVENAISRAVRLVNRVNPISYLNGEAGMPPMFDIIMNSMQVLQHELGNFKAISADVLIKPDLSDFTWIEYYRSEELIRRGEEAAERAIPSIRRALDQKLAVSKHRPVVAKEVTA